MAGPARALPALPPFNKEKKFLDGKVEASIDVIPLSSTLEGAILADAAFPAGNIRLAEIKTGLAGDSGDLQFGGLSGPVVSFKGSAKGGGGIGVYQTSIDMLKDIADENSVLDESVVFPDHGTARYIALNWSYNINGAANGSMALGQLGSVKFGAEASSAGRFLVIQRFDKDPGARTAIQKAISSWKLPRQIADVNDIDPGSWIVAEVNGGVTASLGAEVGFDYSWVRSINLQGLSGDLSLKIQAAAEVSVGFEASGKYAIVISRESLDPASKQVRIRLSKLTKKGWDFALHAQVGVEPSTSTLFPSSLDDFVRAIFGVHGTQIVEDLKEFRRWTDSKVAANTLAGDFLKQLTHAAFGGDSQKAFDHALGFLNSWDSVGPHASSLLASLLNRAQSAPSEHDRSAAQNVVGELTAFLKSLQSGNTTDVQQQIQRELTASTAAPGITRKWLEAVAPSGLLSVLINDQQLGTIRNLAVQSTEVLQSPVLEEVTSLVNGDLSLKNLESKAFNELSGRLQEKLSNFLGKTLDSIGYEQIRTAVASVQAKADDLYHAAIEAANRKYEADFLYMYQSSTSKSALFDGTFDFNQNASLGPILKNTINGDFRTDGVFVRSIPGLTLNQGQFTHGIRRQSSLEINLPYFSSKSGSVTDSLAKMDFRPDGTRIVLESSNEVFRVGQWGSKFAIHMELSPSARSNVRSFATPDELSSMMSTDYQFSIARPKLRTVNLQKQLKPILDFYFPKQFGGDKATLEEWIADLDKHADAVEDNGTGLIGNTIVLLEASVPGRVLGSWLRAPANQKDPAYKEMSKGIQRVMRQLIPYIYFQEPSRYSGQAAPACALMLYTSLPVAATVRQANGIIEFDKGNDFYWDWRDVSTGGALSLMVNYPLTTARLALEMEKAKQVLSQNGNASDAAFYEHDQIHEIIDAALHSTIGRNIFQALLFSEAEIIRGAVDAGCRVGQFFAKKQEEDALEKLDQFGAGIVKNFNDKLPSLFDPKQNPELLRNLGMSVFLEASRALDPSESQTPPSARLEIRAMRTQAQFPPAGFPQQYTIKPEDLTIDQSILSMATAPVTAPLAATALAGG